MDATTTNEISVVFPAYNEEGNLDATMQKSLAALAALFTRFEIIVVNDASTDATGQMADALAARHPEIRVIHQPHNQGAGAALLRGLQEARYALVAHNGMDYPFDFNDLRLMLPLLETADVIVAVRKQRAGYTAYRVLTSVVNLALINLLFGLRLRDYNFIQLYKRTVLEAVPHHARSAAFVTPETIIGAHDRGFRVAEIEIEYHKREQGSSVCGSLRVVTSSLRDMLACWWSRLWRKR